MRFRPRVFLVAVSTLVIAIPQAARSDCLSAEVRVWTSGEDTPSYPIGEKHCVLHTPWNVSVHEGDDYTEGLVPPGYPNGVGVEVWVPAP